ncbi:hypothetical protein EDB86DRAFT_2829235 [Lactarius hatsudake]|nr:hypothetical protein EDB86DRAFT_2829235 [Lactarius hatsudake]
MAVAGVVAALAGCWQWLVVFVQLEAVLMDLRHVVVVVASHRPQWLPTLNIQDYYNHKLASTSNMMMMACHGHPNDDYNTADHSSNDDDDTPTTVQRQHSDNTTGNGSDPDVMVGGYAGAGVLYIDPLVVTIL